MRRALASLLGALSAAGCRAEALSGAEAVPAAERAQVAFQRIQLAGDFVAEGATFADLDRDGHNDVVAGPWWWEGPRFEKKHELYPPQPFDPKGYSDSFFVWPRDVDGDGWLDLVTVGFPGKAAHWLKNPLADHKQREAHWQRTLVFASVDNESPAFTDLTGDGKPELVFHTGKRFGWAEPDPEGVLAPWIFHPLSEELELGAFVHGLGVADVDGDGKQDVLWREGWFRQPSSLRGNPHWEFQRVRFSEREGGAQMFALDVDGDGDNDVVTSLAAHHFGLSWFEQVRQGRDISFVEHRFMDDEPADSPHGVRFGELHALDVADVNGDGLPDVITGKRWWSHGAQGDPEPGSKAVVYWFELVRTKDGRVDFVPHLADEQSGVGVQLTSGDIDRDKRRDLVVANKRGVFVLKQVRRSAEEQAAQAAPAAAGSALTLDFEGGLLAGWTATGQAFEGQPVQGDTVKARGREASRHAGTWWIGGYEKLGDAPQGTLSSAPFVLEKPWASFLVGGGAGHETRVEIVDAADGSGGGGGRVLFESSGANYESLQRVAVDLSAQRGRKVFVRLVDQSSGGWGHINFDDLRFHDQKPELERAADVPRILPPDPVAHAGLAPEEARAAMGVPPGFRVELVASEPDVHQPIALALDDRGRLWVAEAFTYPKRMEGDAGLDDIVVFEDKDGDGRAETRTVFLSGLNLVSGLEVGFGGVWIGAAPYLLFVPDRDGDLVPDGPAEKLLDGWAWQDTHETLNAFTWGPDGWLYGCHGVFTHSRVAKPGTPDAERTPIDAGVWRFHPVRREFEVFAWGTSNPWGVDFDAQGQAFITACVIPHLYHVVQGARYERQAGHQFDAHAFEELTTIADHRHYLGDDPHGGNLRSNSAGGGHAHCGALIYQGEVFPAEYRGALFMNNIHGNRVNVDRLERSGSGFVGRHAPDLLLANDKWFRGINFEQERNGSVVLIDWYDKQACHLTKPEVWDRSNGRIWRLDYGAPRARDGAKITGSFEQLLSPESFVARRARRVLQEQGGNPPLHARLEAVLADGASATRLAALWALHAGGGLREERAAALFDDREEHVAAWAIQLALETKSATPATLAALERTARATSSPLVRLYLASALQRLPVDQRWGIAAALLARAEDAADPNIPGVLWYGIEPLVAADAERALELAATARLERSARLLVRRAAAEPALHAALVRAIGRSIERTRAPAQLAWMLEEFVRGIGEQRKLSAPEGWEALATRLEAEPASRERVRALSLAFGDKRAFPELRARLADPKAEAGLRRSALDALVAGHDPELLPVLCKLLDDAELGRDAIRALAGFDDAQVPGLLLAAYPRFDTPARRDALHTLAARASSATRLLDAVAAGTIARDELPASVVNALESLGDEALRARLHEVWGSVRASGAEVVKKQAEWKARLGAAELAKADLPQGREVFARTCEQCHVLFGAGGKIGPELTGSNRADLDYLLSNVLDPSALVGKDYTTTMVWLADGRFVNGMPMGSTDSTLTLRTENELLVIEKDEIETRKDSPNSLMPEGQLDTLTPEEARALVAYLQSPRQVPLRASAKSLSRLFDGHTLAGWRGASACWSVEDGEIVGRTSGLSKNEFLVSELLLSDFRFTVEVRLVGDQGNSGIQFRTTPREDGDVAGYQADIGPGWWGKLYEENGRGLLFDEERSVQKDGWNRYVIEARGQRVRITLDGRPCADLEDPRGAREGVLALQLHSGGPTEVRFRNLELELLENAR